MQPRHHLARLQRAGRRFGERQRRAGDTRGGLCEHDAWTHEKDRHDVRRLERRNETGIGLGRQEGGRAVPLVIIRQDPHRCAGFPVDAAQPELVLPDLARLDLHGKVAVDK
jgi:hypothetical protein